MRRDGECSRAAGEKPFKVACWLDGNAIGEVTVPLAGASVVRFSSAMGPVSPGEHRVELRSEGTTALPYEVGVRFAQTAPEASTGPLAIATCLSRSVAQEGEPVDLRVEIRNTTNDALPMVVGIVGVPAGLEPRVQAFDAIVAAGAVDFIELRGREIAVYKRAMAPAETLAATLPMIAAFPGEFTGPASRAYPYYECDARAWCAPLHLRVGGEAPG